MARRDLEPAARLREEILARVTISPTGCWLWPHRFTEGYGRIPWRLDGKKDRLAHRVSYEAFVGPIPEGLIIDHVCRERPCVNPSHLEPVTERENILRGVSRSAVNARRASCHRGHPFSVENTRIARNGSRQCRACDRERCRRRRALAAA